VGLSPHQGGPFPFLLALHLSDSAANTAFTSGLVNTVNAQTPENKPINGPQANKAMGSSNIMLILSASEGMRLQSLPQNPRLDETPKD
jgi:hypothetical protein